MFARVRVPSAAVSLVLVFALQGVVRADGEFVYPVGDPNTGAGYTLTQPFHNKKNRTGVDLANGRGGDDIRAIADGIVVDKLIDNCVGKQCKGWGNSLRIRHTL